MFNVDGCLDNHCNIIHTPPCMWFPSFKVTNANRRVTTISFHLPFINHLCRTTGEERRAAPTRLPILPYVNSVMAEPSYSYNNIIEKEEPKDKERFDDLVQPVDAWKLAQRDGVAPEPVVITSWRFDHQSGNTSETDAPTAGHAGHEPSDDEVIVVDHFLTPNECQSIIDTCESSGFTFWSNPSSSKASSAADATTPVDGADDTVPSVEQSPSSAFRTAFTVEVHQEVVAQRLWERLESISLGQIVSKVFSPDMPEADALFEADLVGVWQPVGICDNILFARYRNGGHFAPHVDGSNILDLNTRTLYTLLIYLNDCDAGGETFILKGDQCRAVMKDEETKRIHSTKDSRIGAVVPRRGRAAVFYHNVLHEGYPVVDGHEKYILRADVLYRRDPPILTEPNDIAAFELYQKARLLEADGRANEAVKAFMSVKKLSKGVAALYGL